MNQKTEIKFKKFVAILCGLIAAVCAVMWILWGYYNLLPGCLLAVCAVLMWEEAEEDKRYLDEEWHWGNDEEDTEVNGEAKR